MKEQPTIAEALRRLNDRELLEIWCYVEEIDEEGVTDGRQDKD